jgi:4-amino-4-deoxy-L-arabinose transferase-like glycosyltransferase
MKFPNKNILILIVLIVVFNANTLLSYPPPNGDDAWMASRAFKITRSGSSFGQLDSGVLDRYEGYENFNPWLSSAIQSLGIRLFGEPSLLAIRFTSLALGIGLLVAIYWIGIALDGKQLGLLGVAFTAFSWSFLISAHRGRPDIIAAAFGYAGIALFLNNRSSKFWLSMLVGIFVSLAFEIHAHAAIYSITIFTLFLAQYGLRFFKKIDFWGYALGLVIGIVFFLAIHVFPNPQTYLKLTQIVFGLTHLPPILTLNPSIIWDGLSDTGVMVLFIYPQIFLGLWAIYIFRRGYPKYLNTLLIISGILLISFALLVRTKFLYYYAIHFSPALSLLVAAFFNEFLKSPTKSKIQSRIRQIIVAAICLLPVLPLFIYFQDNSYNEIQSSVSEAIRSEDSILGNQLYWFGLQDHQYYSWENLVFYRRDNPGSNLEDAFLSLRPDIFIMDSQVRNFTFEDEFEVNYLQQFRVPKSELDSFLNQNAELETVIGISEGNPVEIYRINYK